jgi:hypothetical protein
MMFELSLFEIRKGDGGQIIENFVDNNKNHFVHMRENEIPSLKGEDRYDKFIYRQILQADVFNGELLYHVDMVQFNFNLYDRNDLTGEMLHYIFHFIFALKFHVDMPCMAGQALFPLDWTAEPKLFKIPSFESDKDLLPKFLSNSNILIMHELIAHIGGLMSGINPGFSYIGIFDEGTKTTAGTGTDLVALYRNGLNLNYEGALMPRSTAHHDAVGQGLLGLMLNAYNLLTKLDPALLCLLRLQ